MAIVVSSAWNIVDVATHGSGRAMCVRVRWGANGQEVVLVYLPTYPNGLNLAATELG